MIIAEKNNSKWKFAIFRVAFLFCFSVLFVLFSASSVSPLFYTEGDDSAIFKSMGLLITQGGTPYVDYFDHKGPILYFINALGIVICRGKLGLFILQALATFVVFYYLYKIARLFTGSLLSYIVFFLVIALYSITITGGNRCEDWELLVIVPAFYYIIKSIQSSTFEVDITKNAFILGAGFSFCFFIRPNDAVSQIGSLFCGYLFFLLLNRRYKQLPKFFAFFFLSLILITSPIVIYFLFHKGLPELWHGLVYHNLLYISNDSQTLPLIHFKKLLLVPIYAIPLYTLYKNKMRGLFYCLLFNFVLSFVMLGGRLYLHYYTILLPAFSLIICFVLKKKSWINSTLLLIAFLSFFHFCIMPIPSCLYRIQVVMHIKPERNNRNLYYNCFYQQSNSLLENIPKNELDSIWNYNLGILPDGVAYTSVFYHYNIMQANRVPFFEMAIVDAGLKELDNITIKRPRWVALTHKCDDSYFHGNNILMSDFFKDDYHFIETHYEQVARTDTTICDIELWRRRDVIDNTYMDEKL